LPESTLVSVAMAFIVVYIQGKPGTRRWCQLGTS